MVNVDVCSKYAAEVTMPTRSKEEFWKALRQIDAVNKRNNCEM
jgi:hypothetical protein